MVSCSGTSSLITGKKVTGTNWERVRGPGQYIPFTALVVSTAFVEFNVPIQIIAPAHGSIPDTKPERDNRHPFRFGGVPDQPHPGFPRGPATFLVVAGQTSRHDVLPRGPATLDLRNNMVKSELFSRITVAAVLAGVLVALIDIGTRKPDLPTRTPDLYKFKETQNGRKSKGDGHAPHFAVVEVDDLYFPLRKKGNGPLPRNDLERLER